MLVQIFKPLENSSETFAMNKIGDTTKITSLNIKERFYTYGTFTMEIPSDALFARNITENTLLYIDYKRWFRVDGIIDSGGMLEITGKDLKGLLADRITIYGMKQDTGTAGYDVFLGTTEEVLKHYIKNNLVNPVDENRRIFGLEIGLSLCRGIQQDSYMSRFENVAELAEKVCKNAKIGYKIDVDFERNKMIFDVIVGENKVENQSVKNRVVFDIGYGNIARVRYETNISSGSNAFYTTKSGASLEEDAVTQLIFRENETAPSGVYRREKHLNVSCKSVGEMDVYARKEMENYIDANSFEVDVKSFSEYGTIYNLGDIVTVKGNGITLDTNITEAETIYQGNSMSLRLTFGDKKPKPINILQTKINNQGV